MPPGDGWYLMGPLVAVALVCLLGAVICQLGLHWTLDPDQDPLREPAPDGLAILSDLEDYGLLCPAAVAEDRVVAAELIELLVNAGIRATCAPRRDGSLVILVFGEHAEQARRLVGDLPAL